MKKLLLCFAFALFLAASLPASTLAQTSRFVVCIDPGHPSETAAGAVANGLSENRLNWQVAQLLKRRLDARGILNVMTKQRENQRVTNRDRARIANGANKYRTACAIFIRLHCDVGRGSGFAWYYPDRAARKQGVYGPSPAVQAWSRAAAQTMNNAMIPILRPYLRSNPIKTDAATGVGGRQGGVLTGSIFSEVPTALIEMCFINNRRDARFIASSVGRQKMAEALEQGILSWRSYYLKNRRTR